MADKEPLLVSVSEAARRLGINEHAVRGLIRNKRINTVQIEGMRDTRRIVYADLKRWVHELIVKEAMPKQPPVDRANE